ncbi:hypothetical protein HPB50_020292 [Hyalomma asiaticum]|uniref:Uncharacterized protein n=1 Tax=Hyalomma asiaticum TaxID=266040 RepID=A0ACB7T0G5_HYAAI|nr:hypothetical protein HPB50_020292 [Hyalomma asiaticum]
MFGRRGKNRSTSKYTWELSRDIDASVNVPEVCEDASTGCRRLNKRSSALGTAVASAIPPSATLHRNCNMLLQPETTIAATPPKDADESRPFAGSLRRRAFILGPIAVQL